MPKNRPCVVIAGGREPEQWESYPHHQYIRTSGALRCCDNGGCWKSRMVPLSGRGKKDESLCVDVVEVAAGCRTPGAERAGKFANDETRMTKSERRVYQPSTPNHQLICPSAST